MKKEKKKIPESWAEAEFSKFSSGSDGSGLEDAEDEDIEEMYHNIEEERDTLFKSDHEFSCESEDEDEKIEVHTDSTNEEMNEILFVAGEARSNWHKSEEEEKGGLRGGE